MRHKKQAHENIDRTIKWNTDRGNTTDTLNWDLEYNMLKEELEELNEATAEVDKLDALLDLIFVATGSMGKMGLTAYQIVDAYELVMKANEAKSKTKNAEGKIVKNADFQPPEPALQKILDNRHG